MVNTTYSASGCQSIQPVAEAATQPVSQALLISHSSLRYNLHDKKRTHLKTPWSEVSNTENWHIYNVKSSQDRVSYRQRECTTINSAQPDKLQKWRASRTPIPSSRRSRFPPLRVLIIDISNTYSCLNEMRTAPGNKNILRFTFDLHL